MSIIQTNFVSRYSTRDIIQTNFVSRYHNTRGHNCVDLSVLDLEVRSKSKVTDMEVPAFYKCFLLKTIEKVWSQVFIVLFYRKRSNKRDKEVIYITAQKRLLNSLN